MSSSTLHGVISQKMILFKTTAVKTSNPIYKTMFKLLIKYGSDRVSETKGQKHRNWNFRFLAGYTRLLKEINTEICEKHMISSIVEEITAYTQRLKEHVWRMDEDKWPKEARNYKPTG
jgi:hypothetical protein